MVYLCGGDFTLRPDTESDCPDRDTHSPMPSGYVDRSMWADAMIRVGANQLRCGTCGLYAVWTPPACPLPKGYR
jgi:hypothetical protein